LPELSRLIERVRKIADGAALMTEPPKGRDFVGPGSRTGTAERAVPAEQFDDRHWPNNATRLDRIDWLWAANRAWVAVTGDTAAGSIGRTHHAHLHHRQ